MSLVYVLMFLKVVEALIMLIAVGLIVYYLINPTKKNIHLSYGRPYIAIITALGWAKWTYNFLIVDYVFFIEMNKVIESTTVVDLIQTELLNIGMTILTAMHMLGSEFKCLKRSK